MQHIRPRTLESAILRDLARKMVWISGPRQVGKTTLMRHIGLEKGNAEYLNWDDPEHRDRIIRRAFGEETTLLLFDELHKYPNWKNYLKGLFDTQRERYSFLVSGSARLEVYRRGGDSLLGRYYRYRLHPFSVAELLNTPGPTQEPGTPIRFAEANPAAREALDTLLEYGGFPEPLLAQDAATLRRFQNQRIDRVIHDDIRDVESVRMIGGMDLLSRLLPEKVGSLLSVNSLREDLSVAHATAAHWMDILESFYVHYRLAPYASSVARTLRKEPRLYLWDWSVVPEEGARRENLVASHLLKFVHALEDEVGQRCGLHFLRDRDGRETDFLVTHEGRPWFAVEVKSGQTQPDAGLLYFRDRLPIPHVYQLTTRPDIARTENNVHIVSADRFLASLV
jgi:uncharacterized protein